MEEQKKLPEMYEIWNNTQRRARRNYTRIDGGSDRGRRILVIVKGVK